MKKYYLYVFSAIFGSVLYPLIEIMYRGRTHYSMMIAGGVGFFLIFLTYEVFDGKHPLLMAFMGGISITLIEFIIGVIFNLWLKKGVWTYSELPINVMGQICLGYSFLWFLLSVPCLYLCKIIDKKANKT